MRLYKDLEVFVSGKKITDYTSFIWTDRYNTCGDFELILPYTNENANFYKTEQIVTCSLSERQMIIESIGISISADNGRIMKISGRSFESILDRRVVANTIFYDNSYFMNNKFINAFSSIVNMCFGTGNLAQFLNIGNAYDPESKYYAYGASDQKRSYGINVLLGKDSKKNISNAQINIEATGKSVLELLETHCQAKDFGFKLINHTLTIYDGSTTNYTFSIENGNLVSAEYQSSLENYKNVAYVQGDEYQTNENVVEVNGVTYNIEDLEENGQAIVLNPDQLDKDPIYYRVQVDLEHKSGLNRRETYIESSKSIGQNTNAKYCARLSAEGIATLMHDYRPEPKVSCEIMHNAPDLIYGKNFSLGDILNVSLGTIVNPLNRGSINDGKGNNFKMRVNEFTISHSDAGLELYPTLVEYDPKKITISNYIDAGKDWNGGEDDSSSYNQKYNKWIKCKFLYNGGSADLGGISFSSASESNLSSKKDSSIWYMLPDGVTSGTVIDSSEITGTWNWQQCGDWLIIPSTEPVKEHYIFKGWFLNGRQVTNKDEEYPFALEDYSVGELTFVALWEIEVFDITFDHGTGGHFSAYPNTDQITESYAYGTTPTPPSVFADQGYRAASPLWSPDISPVESETTYTAQWEEIDEDEPDDEDIDPEDSEYDEDQETIGVTPKERSSTAAQNTEKSSVLGLVHFKSFSHEVGDEYALREVSSGRYSIIRSVETNQRAECLFTRDLGNGYTMQAHWYDPYGLNPSYFGSEDSNAYKCADQVKSKTSSTLGISIIKNGKAIGCWSWSCVGGYYKLPELAFTTIPVYVPYYEYTTLLDGYNRGDITLGLISNAPIFIPFKYYKEINGSYWMLCVPPIDWLSNWQNYYYYRKAGNEVGFTCQFYDNLGNMLLPTWGRDDSNNTKSVKINGTVYAIDRQNTYGYYYDDRHYYSGTVNTIYRPYSQVRNSSTYIPGAYLDSSWNIFGWKWVKIPDERWDATEVYTANTFDEMSSYSGELAINMQQGPETTEGSASGQSWGGAPPVIITIGMIYGPGFKDFETFHSFSGGWISSRVDYYWPESERKIGSGLTNNDFKILYKQSGETGLAAKVIQKINNVISKSNSFSYFTYKVWLPLMSRIKSTTWYVSSDGQTWHSIGWAHGNSLKVRTTSKTVAQNEAEGLTGADAIIGTNGSKYKAEVNYTDENGNEFVQTSDIGTLSINDTDISGSGIELGDRMNPDGTTSSIDIDDFSSVTDTMGIDDVNGDQKNIITNMFNSGSTSKQISETTGIPESIINAIISTING